MVKKNNNDEVEDSSTVSAESEVNANEDQKSVIENIVETVEAAAGSVAAAVSEAVSDVVASVSSASEEGQASVSDKKHGKRAERIGVVASDKMTKTVVVRVDRLVKHPVYRKYVRRRKRFMAHDELGAKIGDKVRIAETRPLSAKKRWRVVEIIHKAEL